MPETTLSPSLAHLLITEDRSTGKLFLPDGTAASPTAQESVGQRQSPPFASPPSTFAASSLPPHSHSEPRRTIALDQRRPDSLFALISDLQVRTPSPPTSASPVSHAGSISPTDPNHSSLGLPPLSANSAQGQGQFRRPLVPNSAPILRRPSSRPELPRRGSSQNQLQARYRPASSYEPPSILEQQLQLQLQRSHQSIGGRAPISRTTKACNACRNRKVRCDAGGVVGNGEPVTCSRCKESGVECVYSGPQKKRGPCPGSTRPPQTVRSRRPSHRSSVTSLNTPYLVVTPGEDQSQAHLQPRRGSGFPFPPVPQQQQQQQQQPHSAPLLPPPPFHSSSSSFPSPSPSSGPEYPYQHPHSASHMHGWTSTQPQARPSTATSASKQRSPYAFPADAGVGSGSGRKTSASVLSWPNMEPAIEVDPDTFSLGHRASASGLPHRPDGPESVAVVSASAREDVGAGKRFFEPDYSMSMRLPSLASFGRSNSNDKSPSRGGNMDGLPFFGGEGRTLPPLSVAIGRRPSYFAL